jgi:hypothetical protein
VIVGEERRGRFARAGLDLQRISGFLASAFWNLEPPASLSSSTLHSLLLDYSPSTVLLMKRDLANSDMKTRSKGRKEQSFAVRPEHPPMRAFRVTSLSAVAASAAIVLPEAATSLPNLASFCALPSPRKKPSKDWIVSPSPTKKARKSKNPNAPASSSFDALWAGNFTSLQDKNIEAHTLILGTHPSIKSLSENQYYGHPMK